MQCSRVSHTYLQEPLCSRNFNDRQKLPTPPMRQTYTTDNPDAQSNAWLQDKPQPLCMGTSPWKLQLQQNIHSATRNKSPHPQKTSNRMTWAPHAIKGWYVGPTLHAYQCNHTWITETKREHIADTLTWFPTMVPMSTISSKDIISSATCDILQALQNPLTGYPLATSNGHRNRNTKTIGNNSVQQNNRKQYCNQNQHTRTGKCCTTSEGALSSNPAITNPRRMTSKNRTIIPPKEPTQKMNQQTQTTKGQVGSTQHRRHQRSTLYTPYPPGHR